MSDAHLGGAVEQGDSNTLLYDVISYLIVKYEIRSVLDIGSGFGHMMKWVSQNCGCRVHGIDGWKEAIDRSLIAGNTTLHDFTTGPAPVGTPSDLAWSAEFLEHVDEKFIPNFMPAFQLCRYACVTHGEPGQYGHNHVNLKPTSYWVKVFKDYGFKYDAKETALLRRTDRWAAGWGRRTLAVFHRL